MSHHRWLGILALGALALAGCGKTSSLESPAASGPATGSDEAAVAQVVQSNPDFVSEPVWQDQTPTTVEGDAQGFAAIRPLRFWREITQIESDIHTEFGNPDPNGRPTLALVTVRRHLHGSFNIVAGEVPVGDTSRVLVRKPLDDLWTRKVALVRMPAPDDTGLTRWHLAGTSGVDVRTRAGQTRVLSLRIEAADMDTTITDPLELHRLRHILRFVPATEVRLTATTADPSDVVLFYGNDLRRRFKNNGGGTHSFVFPVSTFPGLRHFGVDALSHDTLFDDALPYDSNAWIFAYAVIPIRLPAGN